MDNKTTPTAKDYVIYFMVSLISSLSNERKSLINNSIGFLDVYYSLVDLIFKIEDPSNPGENKKMIVNHN